MPRPTDVSIEGVRLYFLPIKTRVPLKFGNEIVNSVTCARVCIKLRSEDGRTAIGWGETPLSIQWIWPSTLPYDVRHEVVKTFCIKLVKKLANFSYRGHPIEISHAFQSESLHNLLNELNNEINLAEPMPWLAALVAFSAFDLALHDGYGVLHQKPIFELYTKEYLSYDLSYYLKDVHGCNKCFKDKYPGDFLVERANKLLAWHLVGGMDKITHEEIDINDPNDNYPVTLIDWIKNDQLKCLKIKLTGNDQIWDYSRIVQIGKIAQEFDCWWLSADFNCTVKEPSYVIEILDKLMQEFPRIYGMLLYIEQPFPYDLEKYKIDVHAISARKPLFLDESAHDWTLVQLGRTLGWTGVALKTCKTLTGALLTLSWAKYHGMTIMVQDLTNPMLAQIPHLLLAAYAGTIMGVETNSMQFYPQASLYEAAVHPGLYSRKNGCVDLSSLNGHGFGYRINEIKRPLPPPVAEYGF